jgi:hypothetical protein
LARHGILYRRPRFGVNSKERPLYGVSFTDTQDVKNGQIVSDALKQRLEMMIRDVRVYGELLARQRRADLAATDPGFMARLRD